MPKAQGSHESFDRLDHVKVGSDRMFGLVFAGFFSIVGGIKLWSDHDLTWVGVWFAAAVAMLVLALALPRVLRPLNLVWFKFGLLLHRVVSPVVMGLMFFVVITPTGIVMRVLGKRPLNLSFDPKVETYWIARTPPGPLPASMNQQF